MNIEEKALIESLAARADLQNAAVTKRIDEHFLFFESTMNRYYQELVRHTDSIHNPCVGGKCEVG